MNLQNDEHFDVVQHMLYWKKWAPVTIFRHGANEIMERSDLRMDALKILIGEKALAEGIIKDPQWLEKLDESMPVWAVLEIALNLLEKLDPPCGSYD